MPKVLIDSMFEAFGIILFLVIAMVYIGFNTSIGRGIDKAKEASAGSYVEQYELANIKSIKGTDLKYLVHKGLNKSYEHKICNKLNVCEDLKNIKQVNIRDLYSITVNGTTIEIKGRN